mgnify:CR=1 FL=1
MGRDRRARRRPGDSRYADRRARQNISPLDHPARPAPEPEDPQRRRRFPGNEPPVWRVPLPRNVQFVGRGPLLEEMRDWLSSSDAGHVPLALHGLGGVGDATVGTVSGDTGTLKIVDPTSGAQQDWPLMRENGAWFVDVDRFAPRLSFFFDSHLDFFEEIAKFRAARRIWARHMKERYKAKNPRSWLLRFHTQTAGCSLTAQQPLLNIVRTAYEALAGVLGGTQSLHTNSMDEALALPSEEAVEVALRTQQILAHEIGVASTKAFTTQLLSLLIVTLMMAKHRGLMDDDREREFVSNLTHAAAASDLALKMSDDLKALAKDFADKQHTLFLGRGPMWPIAMEGALKLKEISYIHAEAYAAGELKHGPLALIDDEMPVVVVAPNNELLEKLKSNMQVVRARGGQLYVFADAETGIESEEGTIVMQMPHADRLIAPIVYTIPLQLLAYHVAVLLGTDVDQPRNLAKSVTVE